MGVRRRQNRKGKMGLWTGERPDQQMISVDASCVKVLVSCVDAILEDRGGDDTTNNAAHMINIEAVVVLILCVEEGTKFHGLGTFVLFESSFFTTLGLDSLNFQSQR
ncbi:hypothetical protein WN943_028477 [Citrus x changshan-huyou]